jgi:FkbM family methyltransferase
MNTKFPFYCYIDGYHTDPTLYHFEPDKYSYENIRSGEYPKVCYAYLEAFDFKKYHCDGFLTTGNSILEANECVIDASCDIFVDVGANCGLTSYFAYQRGAKRIIAFEPSPKESKSYLMNNIPNSTLYQFAISDSVGFKNLNTVWSKENNLQDDKYIKKDESLTYCVTLDYLFDQNLFEKIDFLKVDVEGHEYNVFRGISDDNLCKVKNISVEIHGRHINDDPKLGLLFQQNLIERLHNVPYFDGKIYHTRKCLDLYRHSSEGYLYSHI